MFLMDFNWMGFENAKIEEMRARELCSMLGIAYVCRSKEKTFAVDVGGSELLFYTLEQLEELLNIHVPKIPCKALITV
jgi:hypothetical protein